MKQHRWTISMAISCLGMLCVPSHAYNAPARVRADIFDAVGPFALPHPRLPYPSVISGPQNRLPSPELPSSIPGGIQVLPFAALRPEARGFFSATQKVFASAPNNSGPSKEMMDTGFDKGQKPVAPTVDGSETSKDPRAAKNPKKKAPPLRDSIRIQVPTWELENEIGI